MEQVRSFALDHHGLVAGTCDDLGLIEKINQRIGSQDCRRVIQPGIAIKAMIINGLGFTSRQLYLTPQFFSSKPVERLLGTGITPEQLDDHTLGKALDEIYCYGATKFFGEIALEIAKEQGLLGNTGKLDSTSFLVHGDYARDEDNIDTTQAVGKESDTLKKAIAITNGYSKAHRPDLKQVMLSMVVSGAASLPFWMQAQDGNSSDKATFQQSLRAASDLRKQLNTDDSFVWIADSALYSKESIQAIDHCTWITRVPESIKECKEAIEKERALDDFLDFGDGYTGYLTTSDYGGIPQQWLVVHSVAALKRETETLERQIIREQEHALKACWHLKNMVFNCRCDAEKHLADFAKDFKHHNIQASIQEVRQHAGQGRPKKGVLAGLVGYTIEAIPLLDTLKKARTLRRKGAFVLATNELDKTQMQAEVILRNYKSQQSVEQGFRFLKEPQFMADTLFLKSPERIEALMVVMCLCLLIYNFAQHKLRAALEVQKATLPNQKKKEIANPTLKWVFQLMEGVAIVEIYDKVSQQWQSMVTNLHPIRQKILKLFGGAALKIYGIL